MTRPDFVKQIRAAAARVDEAEFVRLLRWYRGLAGRGELDWGTGGSYWRGVAELPELHARSLQSDLRCAHREAGRHGCHGADGKPAFSGGRTLADLAAERRRGASS